MSILRKTILSEVTFEGVGLHSGNKSKVTIRPLLENKGIVFKQNGFSVVLDENSLNGGNLGSNVFISSNESVRTVEHLLSAMVSIGIDDALIEVEGGEIPILDGSSGFFYRGIEEVGVTYTGLKKEIKKVTEEKSINVDGCEIKIEPINTESYEIEVFVDFDTKTNVDMPKSIIYKKGSGLFKDYIKDARTFCFDGEVGKLKEMGLCLGGSLDNAIVISNDCVVNKGGFRFNNEVVAHKLLDLIGDLLPIFNNYYGFKITAYKPGHRVNNIFLKEFMKEGA